MIRSPIRMFLHSLHVFCSKRSWRLEKYHGYRFTEGGAGAVPGPAALRDQTCQLCNRWAMAFLCLLPGPDNTRHKVRIPPPRQDVTGFHDRVLGLLGDIRPRQYPPVVEVPSTT
jgi:hypothetical protein